MQKLQVQFVSEILKYHALTSFEYLIKYFKGILDGFPEEHLETSIGQAKSPMTLLKHVGGTSGWWMKRRGTPFEFSSSVKSLPHFFEVLQNQLNAFRKLLEDKENVYWKDSEKPSPSIPWIMIRSYNHGMHHGAMIILYRHYHGLPPVTFPNGMNWGDFADLTPSILYEKDMDFQ